ncbi:hypothetical protein [Ethanoligenens sp.]|uniref:hypothetical protein n=1 Tax=Ethanoligenens sp. TaxID=2099655 RepID=UPI0039EB5564
MSFARYNGSRMFSTEMLEVAVEMVLSPSTAKEEQTLKELAGISYFEVGNR